ncbi:MULTISPECIES: MASE4 domain-containing protein [unclassified Roseovarius]|uniref:MASE4 domain-containing protein n=1 Tax=unclassified Roseovarius TaxID=2614913 RepID=UPI00273F4AAF|nr:MASE4 domain-containing protein [Roseovarius sp. MMSF_3350]
MRGAASSSSDGQLKLISRKKPSRLQIGLAAGSIFVLAAIALLTAGASQSPTQGGKALLPAYAACILIVEVLTASLLLTLYRTEPSLSLLILSTAYLFTGLMVVPWALTFPGIFDDFRFDVGLQTTAFIAAIRRLGFPILILAYALLKNASINTETNRYSPSVLAISVCAIVILLVFAISWFAISGRELLPTFMMNPTETTRLWNTVPIASILISCTVLVLLSRKSSTLDLWLMVAIGSSIIETILLAYVGGGTRLSASWWAGRLCGLFSASILLLLMIAETMALYERLAKAIASERRMKETRVSEMEAMSASIIHELTQPLASISVNANAAQNWLAKDPPNVEEAEQSVRQISSDSHRTSEVIQGLRSVFKKAPQDFMRVDIKRTILDAVKSLRSEATEAHVSIKTDLGSHPLAVHGNAVQLQQVVRNIILNAIEAMSTTRNRARILSVSSRPQGEDELCLSFTDTGPGINSADQERIFDPFFSSKPYGLGIGLMVSRSIIEAHGGRLDLGKNGPDGVTVELTLKTAE